ncbi:DEAD/DEAH box helicase [Palaeococcus ferrophilus]|uniref:DEAD/DEAH box helicase n=1 Tax=Palaeococcus ferrophilus TaxID=83868 RepID=UPI00064F97A5|nr:DEAD/DEAH box helicase [Palaeococcus ferrophilus]
MNTVTNTITLRIPDGSARAYIVNAPPKAYFLIENLLTYKRDFGKWKRAETIYDPYERALPVGVIPRVREFFREKGIRVRVRDERTVKGVPINGEWNEEIKLRPYQQRGVKKALKAGMGVLALPVGSGKTIVGLRIIHELNISSLIIVHTKELLYQWAEQVERVLGVKPGIVGDNNWEERPVTVAMIQTLLSRGVDKLSLDYGVVMFDECHRTSAAEKFFELGMSLPQKYRFGLSATPWRRVKGEEIKIEGAIGPIIYEIRADTLIKEGFLARPRFKVLRYESEKVPFSERYKEFYEEMVMNHHERNRAIVSEAVRLAKKGHRVLIDVKRIEHGEELVKMLKEHGVNAEFLSSQTPNRWEILEAYRNGEINVLVSTLLKEGVDIPEISAIILAGGGKSDVMTIQTIGRALRPKNGKNAVIVDVLDDDPLLFTHFIERQKALLGYYGKYYDRALMNEFGIGEKKSKKRAKSR